ncbi:coat protein [Black raspberry virus F]|uniref:coat protein n=1 Tax=Black raspberry virus F TaxID=463392 RepID=UPI00015C2F60|nr:coat protein [Black raspberry virus F]ABU55398.1 coat protein [Black raspberry virus F]
MDAFLKKFFEGFEAPGAEFSFNASPARIYTFFQSLLRVDCDGVIQNRPFYVNQPMTPLGKMTARFGSTVSTLDGISKPYLTPEGVINLNAIGDVLKSTGGMTSNAWSLHMGVVKGWNWADNHVPLLVNMLRYTLIKHIQTVAGTLDATLGTYDDGHVTINSDGCFTEAYPEEAAWDGWPFAVPEGQAAIEAWTQFTRFETAEPQANDVCLDLRNLTPQESAFVLLMCTQWQRKSRLRLDFALPELAHAISYRASAEPAGFAGWLSGTYVAAQGPPAAPGPELAWSALKKYVNQNRLYDHFSTALYLVACSMYQFAPVTAEAHSWLDVDWDLSLPLFHSVRGRYTFLNEDEAAFISHRALNEWSYYSVNINRINLLALTFSQAYHTGFAVRNVRKSITGKLDDIYTTEGELLAPISMIPSAASEAVRAPVPLSGMSGVYMYTQYNLLDYDPNRTITLENDYTGEDDGYDLIEPEVTTRTEVTVRAGVDLNALLLGGPPAAGTRGGNNAAARGRGLGRGGRNGGRGNGSTSAEAEDGDENLTIDNFDPNDYFEVVEIEEPAGPTTLRVPWMTFPGYPTMLVPIDPFPDVNIFTLKGKIDGTTGDCTRWGFKTTAMRAWYVANLYRLCGYDLDFSSAQNLVGGEKFYAPNNVGFVWPILYEPNHQHDEIVINYQQQRMHHFITLPQIINNFFKNKTIEFSHRIIRRGTTTSAYGNWLDVVESSGVVQMFANMTVAYNTSAAVSRLRAYITRSEEGFRFVDNVQGGAIPPPTE